MVTDHDPRTPGGTDKCRCASCGEYFARAGTFTEHRVGSYAPLDRRCLTLEEMTALGWFRTSTGHWQRSGTERVTPAGFGAAT